ncbi:MAG: hypothetical protein CVV52_00515 [Spirochaetae bacterium HGW-Spirochaetae-8]|jgi:uncharacterized coiled-coil protein SlyX|nr:MAG: hypothetical protein CVV52_00515 [Spirochaetae bacterium HGW-Spirochaetae-8]
MEERLMQVEMKISFMEDTVATLNALVAEQRKELDTLKAIIERLEARLAAGEESMGDLPNRKPPHY